MGLNNLLHEVIKEDETTSENGDNDQSVSVKDSDSDEDYDKKSDTAIDYSDITELADEIQSSMPVIWLSSEKHIYIDCCINVYFCLATS